MEKTSTGFYWGSRVVIPLEVNMTVSAGGPIFCFVVWGNRVFITNVKGTFLGMSESEEASKRR